MMVEGGGSTCSWTATGVDRLWAFVEPSMETYEMTSCEELLPTNRSMLRVSLLLTTFAFVGLQQV